MKEGDHIPGTIVNQFINDYCTIHDLHKHFRLEHDVQQVMKLDDAKGWDITVKAPANDGSKEKRVSVIRGKKLVVATGLTSEPNMPSFEGENEFNVPLLHVRDLGENSDLLNGAQRVVVLGGTKSASDAAYQYAMNGVHVDWVIRESGHG